MKISSLLPICIGAILVVSCDISSKKQPVQVKPNFIIFFCDDLGYGDIGPFGHPTISTPNLDRMAEEGQKWTSFYAAAPVCTPSRAGLLTGRLPIRSGMCSEKRRVLFPDSNGGLPEKEITIAKALKGAGYTTACIGKWHLGHLPQYSPNAHGFDFYYGIPYSNDMDRIEGINHYQSCTEPNVEYFQVPLMRNSEIIERPADQTTITKRYTEETIRFIAENQDKPFFVYLAHSMPHVPLFRSKEFENKSRRGIYGDVIEELDWSIGKILDHLRNTGLDKNTLVVFTSDNGPWLTFYEQGGAAGLLKEGKGSTWEGGMREPAIFWWPGKLKHKVVMELSSTLDLFPTLCNLAGAEISEDRIYDGYDLSPVLLKGEKSPRDLMFFYRDTGVFAVRKGSFKAHFKTEPGYGDNTVVCHDPPLLFNLDVDPSEKYNVAKKYPEVIEEIKGLLENHKKSVAPVENQLEKIIVTSKGEYQKKSL
jgi:arylsulfatase A